MSTRQVRITFNNDGTTKVDAENFMGVGCKDATEALAIAIGGSDNGSRKDDPKPEFYAATDVGQGNYN